MKYLTREQVIKFHQALIETSGGSLGIRDEGMLNSALKLHYRLTFESIFRTCKVYLTCKAYLLFYLSSCIFPLHHPGCKVANRLA